MWWSGSGWFRILFRFDELFEKLRRHNLTSKLLIDIDFNVVQLSRPSLKVFLSVDNAAE